MLDEPSVGHWEEQTRVGEREKKVCEEKKNFAVKVCKIAKMLVRMVAFEGLQPMVTEAFMRERNPRRTENLGSQ